MKRPTLDDVYTLDSRHYVIEEEMSCAVCGDPFEVGERVLEAPLDPSDPTSRLIVTEHLYCAVRYDEVELQRLPKWNVFDEHQQSTWPAEKGHYWVVLRIADGDPIVTREWWSGKSVGSWPVVHHWMPIEKPEPPVAES